MHIPFLSPLWFLRDLMVMVIISPLIKLCVGKMPNVSLVVALILILIPQEIFLQVALSWFVIGAYVVKENKRVEVLDSIPFLLLSLVYSVLILFDVLICKNHTITAIIKLLGVIMCIRLSGCICNKKTIEKRIMKYTPYAVIIYFGHENTLGFLKMLFLGVMPQNSITIALAYFGLPLVIMCLCVIAGTIMKRHTPHLYSIATGNR